MSRRNRALASAGFTLVELMISSVIFLIGAVSFTYAYTTAIRTQWMADGMYRATCIARNRIQRAKGMEFGSLMLMEESYQKIDSDGNVDSMGKYMRTTMVNTNLPQNAVEISVDVYFPDKVTKTSAVPVHVQTVYFNGM